MILEKIVQFGQQVGIVLIEENGRDASGPFTIARFGTEQQHGQIGYLFFYLRKKQKTGIFG